MRKEEFAEVLGGISEDYVKEAETAQKTEKPSWVKWGAAAACLCLVVLAAMTFFQSSGTPQEGVDQADPSGDGPPHFVIDDIAYIISPHLSVTEELPEGFVPAGNISIIDGFEDCPYYLNPDMPEWVYVYHEVRTDGTVDAAGTLTSTTPHNAYVRYVDERLRGRDLICHNGKYYISMWSAESFGDHPDVTEEYYDEMYALYGLRIEGAAPDGFVLAGTAEFTGYDTVPAGTLASNTEAAEVYYNPDDPAAVLVQTHWFTATAEESGETRHDGFNVYILYDCPFYVPDE